MVNTTGKAFLGLTLECAQCHTHKFDPVTIRDYYRLQAFFQNGQPVNLALSGQEKARDLVMERWKIFDETLQQMGRVRQKRGIPNPFLILPKTVVKNVANNNRERFATLEKEIAALSQTWAFYSPAPTKAGPVVTPHEMRWPLPRDETALMTRQTRLLIRGDVKSPGPEVRPGWPRVFGESNSEGAQAPAKTRLDLARWMTSPSNPLVARVWVNRIWQWHFGKGIVESSGDFGTQGTPPAHPELLDFLACELIDNRWSTRHIHRLIVHSSTYRQSNQFSTENDRLDPGNRLLWRWLPRRLEAEAIRDSMLAVSGLLDHNGGGPSDKDHSGSKRRGVYLQQKRDNLPGQQLVFDGAGGIVSCSKRRVSTTALQPLWLLNAEFSQRAAEALAKRSGSARRAFVLAMGRSPSGLELGELEKLGRRHGLKSVCLAILNSSEFLYIR